MQKKLTHTHTHTDIYIYIYTHTHTHTHTHIDIDALNNLSTTHSSNINQAIPS